MNEEVPTNPGSVMLSREGYVYVLAGDGYWYSDIGQKLDKAYMGGYKVLFRGIHIEKGIPEPVNRFAIVREKKTTGLTYVSMRDYTTNEIVWAFDDNSGTVKWEEITKPVEVLFEGVKE